MPAHHVAKAAVVLIAASAVALPTVDIAPDGAANDSFIEILMTPGDHTDQVAFAGSTNASCAEH